MAELNAQEIINFIANADKKTPVKVYLNASIADLDIPNEIKVFGGADSAVLFVTEIILQRGKTNKPQPLDRRRLRI